jgi:thiopurine S-methyltransferase
MVAAMQDVWLARWREGRIAFHEGRPNELLEPHVERLAGCRRVLVPLCGKAVDLAFLAARGHEVIGIELAEQAVRTFFDEQGLVPTIAPRGPFAAWTARLTGAGGTLTLLVGDFFAATPELLGPIDAIYDRAALIALPPDLRPRYAATLRGLLPAGGPAIAITLEYDQSAMAGPPFAVLEAELRALYAGADIELLAERDAPEDSGKCSQADVPATERCFLIRFSGARS